MLTGLVIGEPEATPGADRAQGHGRSGRRRSGGPFAEFFKRRGAFLVLLFILLHKIGDTLGQLVLRLLLDDMGYTNDEIAIWDVGVGFWAYLIGIFVGGVLYAQIGMKRSVLISLILMGVSNCDLRLPGHGRAQTNSGLAACIGFENFASGIGGVVVVAYFSALCNLRFTASQYALISAAASVVGRVLTGTTAGALVEAIGYVNFYWLTTVAALAGHHSVLADDALRPGRQLDRHRRGRRRGRRAGQTVREPSPAAARSSDSSSPAR